MIRFNSIIEFYYWLGIDFINRYVIVVQTLSFVTFVRVSKEVDDVAQDCDKQNINI